MLCCVMLCYVITLRCVALHYVMLHYIHTHIASVICRKGMHYMRHARSYSAPTAHSQIATSTAPTGSTPMSVRKRSARTPPRAKLRGAAAVTGASASSANEPHTARSSNVRHSRVDLAITDVRVSDVRRCLYVEEGNVVINCQDNVLAIRCHEVRGCASGRPME